ncbi:MAG: tetratricopeptide repeat protein [Coleofasciculus sp. S288]|nr:tetratricopeptide repeat protein [Coleofasciculus sp. S288]
MWLVAVVVCLGWILSVCLHEFGHAVVAYFGGDTSVKDKGYLTLNPLKYTDPGLSLLLPILFLLMGGIALPGGAVYIDRRRLRSRWWESAVSAAGPVASAVVALLLAIPFGLGWAIPSSQSWLWLSLAFLCLLEIASVLLNLLPIPPLDGYGIIEPWLPHQTRIQFNKFGKYGIWFLFGLLWFVDPLNQLLWNCTYTISEFLNVPSEMAVRGYVVFREHVNILIVGLIGVLWIFRRKEVEWYNRGNTRLENRQYEKAIAAYEQAIKIKPDYYEAWYYKGSALYQLQRYEEALASYDQAIQIKPDSYETWYAKGCSLGQLLKYEEAIASYEQVVQIKPDYYEAWYNKGYSLCQLLKYEEAIASFEKALQIQPDFADAWYNKACCYALQGNVSLALETLQQAIKLDPDQFREQAKTDSCFDAIRRNQHFKDLMGE